MKGFVGAILLLMLAGCGVEENTVRIGAIFMLSDFAAEWGEQSQMGADLAVKRINENGGINGKTLEIVYEDNQADDSMTTMTVFRRLRSMGIRIFLGPNWSQSGKAIAPIVCDDDAMMISPSLGVADFNEECDRTFNLWPHDKELSKKLGGELYDQGFRRLAIMGSLQIWENEQAAAVKEGFEGAGGEVVAYEILQMGQRDLRGEVLKVAEAEPDAVVFTNAGTDHITAIRLRELGVPAKFFSVLLDNDRVKAANGAFEETVIISSFTPNDDFRKAFVAEYGEQPDIGSDTTYDAVMLLARAMEETGSEDPEVVSAYINKLDRLKGVSGVMEFDGKGGVNKAPRYMVVRDGMIQPLE